VRALYADMGHFGRKPIRSSWYWIVLFELLLSYAGQTVDGDASIRRMQSGGIVDAVAEKTHRLPHALQRHDHTQLLLRRDAPEQSCFAQTPDQRIVGQ